MILNDVEDSASQARDAIAHSITTKLSVDLDPRPVNSVSCGSSLVIAA
jgi:hypothetical protein